MKNRGHKFLLILVVAGLAAVCILSFILFDALIIEPNWITVRYVEIDNPGLFEALKGVTIAQVSDLHLEKEFGFREKSLIKKLNRLSPHLILFTGDLVESEEAASLVVKLLNRLKPQLWSYGVLGNADCAYLRGEEFRTAWKRAGLSLIGGRSLMMDLGEAGSPFWLAGIDFKGERSVGVESEVEKILQRVPPSAPVIFLSYSPDLAPLLIEKGADLVLSGDTHGGQVTFPGWTRLFQEFGRSPFIRGLYRIGEGYLYVNRGIATKVLPVRFLCPPEITVFQFNE